MHLVRMKEHFIEDLEGKVTYIYEKGLPDYETGEPSDSIIYVMLWDFQDDDIRTDLAHGEQTEHLWDYLVSQLKFDARQPIKRRFKVGESIRINNPDGKNHDEVGTVERVSNVGTAAQPYEVRFTFIESGDDWDEMQWYRESELTLFEPLLTGGK